MNPIEFDRLGLRNSAGAFIGFLVAAHGTAFLFLIAAAIVATGTPDTATVFSELGKAVVSTGRSTGTALDGLAAVLVTVLIGFYVAIIGGQFSPTLEVPPLISKLSLAGQVLAATFWCMGDFRIVSSLVDRHFGVTAILIIEMLVIAGLAVELTSYLLLNRKQQLDQNRRVLLRARERIERSAGLLRVPAGKRSPVLTLLGITAPVLPSVLLAGVAPGARPSFALFVLVSGLLAQCAWFLVHWAGAGEGPRFLSWVSFLLPGGLGLVVLLLTVQLVSGGLPWAGAAVAASFVLVAVANLPPVPALRTMPLSLRDAALWSEIADAVSTRRRALRRLGQLAETTRASDESALLAWLQRP